MSARRTEINSVATTRVEQLIGFNKDGRRDQDHFFCGFD
jgi:hypothetical protein